MTRDELINLARKILITGPTRVVVDKEGTSISPQRLTNLKKPVAIYSTLIRVDGWSLGAPYTLMNVARNMWYGQWVATVDMVEKVLLIHAADYHTSSAISEVIDLNGFFTSTGSGTTKILPNTFNYEMSDWTPTPENIEKLPLPIRDYIVQLEAKLDEAMTHIGGLESDLNIIKGESEPFDA